MTTATRIGPLRRSRPYKSERHVALDEAFSPDTQPMHYAACESGPCERGQKVCPSPQACGVAERPGRHLPQPWFVRWFVRTFIR